MPSIVQNLLTEVSWTSYAVAVPALLACCLIGSSVYNLYLHPLRNYPGPKLWAISFIPSSYMWMSGRAHRIMLDLHEQYGDVVRVSPGELSFGYPEAWSDVMGHRKRGQEENGKDPEFWRRDVLTMVGSNRERHNRLRKIFSHSFSAQSMIDQEPTFRYFTSLLITRLKEVSTTGEAQDMTSWYNWATFDMIGELTFGEPFGSLESSSYHHWVRLIFKHLKGIAISTALIRYPFSDHLIKLLTPKSVAKDVERHWEYTRAKVAKRMAITDSKPDLMESIIKSHNNGDVSMGEIMHNAHQLIIGGSETTATALSGITYLLATHKPVLEKLKEEVKMNFEHEDDITFVNVQKLDYMMAVIREALRIYPPVPSALPRRAPPSGITIGDRWVPPNTVLSVWQWPIFHNPRFFKNPESFVPDRWLGDPEYDSDQKATFEPFSFGPRNCIGKNLAYAEMRLILAKMLWNFEIELDPRSKGWLDKNVLYFLWDKPPLYVRLTARPL